MSRCRSSEASQSVSRCRVLTCTSRILEGRSGRVVMLDGGSGCCDRLLRPQGVAEADAARLSLLT